ncbi:unnamed protein product [Diatraea saccharalis]|uniref:Uncharacterized protein n=1 Tax=Diatraea saccharalis TaxID=40085 RepID=A0A9N9R6X3_9NEOP|nr:unnamed protein product [Diatraea saccharalis]
MSLLVLEGVTLGQKHKHYNTLVKTASNDETLNLEGIDYEDNDIDNLFRTDVACSRRDVRYIIEVLKCKDMQFVSRALHNSAWLFSDDQYAHIINPLYLQQEIFSKITKKAKNKLLYSIRLNMRNTKRADEFFNYLKENFKNAQKWLPYCSETLTISIVKEEWKNISVSVMHRLCRKSLAILKTCCETCPSQRWLKSGKSFLYTDTKEYLEILNSMQDKYIPQFGKKATRFLMNNVPGVVHENFHKYCYVIDLPEFAKHLKIEEIKSFIIKQLQSDRNEIRSWCRYKYMKHIIERIPTKERFQIVQELFLKVEKDFSLGVAHSEVNDEEMENFYSWYRYVPFEIAIKKLKSVIFDEKIIDKLNVLNDMDFLFTDTVPGSSIRPWAIRVLVRCAAGNMYHIQTLLRYYQEYHTKALYNEYISLILVRITKTYKYDETTWNMLNNTFHKLGVYDDKKILDPAIYHNCIPAIIFHNVLNDKCIPLVIEKKIALKYFINFRQKFEPEESEKVFKYLHKHALKEITIKEINNKFDLVTVIAMCDDFIKFLKHWNKTVEENPSIMEKIHEVVKIIKENSWSTDSLVSNEFIIFYKKHKNIKKYFFEDALLLHRSDETYLIALKYNPDLLLRDKSKIEMIIDNDTISMRRTLIKLRVYWPSSIVNRWSELYLTRLHQTTNNKVCVEALFILLPRMETLTLVDKYVPAVTKINWKEETSTIPFNIRKNICRSLYMIRPTMSLDTVLLYAKGDYFRFAAPLLYDIFLSINYDHASTYILKFLDDSDSFQRLGIRYILENLETVKAKNIVLIVWNKGSYSVKCGLFKHIYKLLIKEKESKMIERIWELLSVLFDYLTPEFYESVKTKKDNINAVPKLIKHKFYIKCFQYLKSYPTTNQKEFYGDFYRYMRFNVELLDIDVVEEVLCEAIDQCFTEDDNVYYYHRDNVFRLLTAYLTFSDSIENQQIKFDKLFLPVIKRFLSVWQNYKRLFKKILESLSLNVSKRLLNTKNYVVPTYLFKKIQNSIAESFSLEKEYNIITFWNLTVIFVELLENFSYSDKFQSICENMKKYYYNYQYECPDFIEVYSNIAPVFGKACLKYFIQENRISRYSFLWPLASKSMMDALISLSFPYSVMNQTLKHMLLDENATEIEACYLIVIGVVRCMYINSGSGEYKFTFDEELKNVILCHPSKVIRTHYRHCDLPYHVYKEDENSDWGRPGLMYGRGRPNDSEVY